MLFKRKLKLTLEIDSDIKVYEHTSEKNNIKVTFNVKKAVDSIDIAQISIIGLNLKDIQNLSTKFDYDNGTAKMNKIILQAGYESDYGIIFSGAIIEAKPNLDNADFVLDLQASAGYYKVTTKREPISIKEAKLRDIAQTIADGYGYTLDFAATDKVIGDYSFIGSASQQFKLFAKDYNVKAWIENGVLFVSDKNKPSQKQGIMISNDSGLIGNPKPTSVGCDFVTLLRPSIQVGTILTCKFEKFPMLNRSYEVAALTHRGSNYDNQFFTEIQGLKGL
ncbi:hypothetical protein CQA66_08440 [Helicobacter aurati]|uniref:Uncharacterized protein n=1 Tax=Helicobacter aurati TaxID=137778 RepID=A0A3D8IYT3_9HELI|nr:hypothetical protein [Helicobacter aurati]RDU70427.1 hypothetical protein CQA66_08440 [Helicobacter aurati]